MNIFDQAMELEREGESLYRQFALEAPHKGMRNIFTWLADQEARHFQIFRELRARKSVTIAESPVLRDIKDIFNSWKDSSVCIEAKAAQVDLYRRALEIEKKSVSVYESYANAGATPQQKGLFLTIAKEEKRHGWILAMALT